MFKINGLLDSHSASSLKQESVARHVAPQPLLLLLNAVC